MMMEHEVFNDDVDHIVDEALTFYIASSQTTVSMMTNLILYTSMDERLLKELRKEIDKKVDWT